MKIEFFTESSCQNLLQYQDHPWNKWWIYWGTRFLPWELEINGAWVKWFGGLKVIILLIKLNFEKFPDIKIEK